MGMPYRLAATLELYASLKTARVRAGADEILRLTPFRMVSHWRRNRGQILFLREVEGSTYDSRDSGHDRGSKLGDVSLAVSHTGVRQSLDATVADGHADKHPRDLDDELEDVCERTAKSTKTGS